MGTSAQAAWEPACGSSWIYSAAAERRLRRGKASAGERPASAACFLGPVDIARDLPSNLGARSIVQSNVRAKIFAQQGGAFCRAVWLRFALPGGVARN